MTTFELFTRNNGRHYYRVIADTGHNILSSDGFMEKNECLEAISQVKEYIKSKDNIRVEKSDENNWKFTLTGKDNIVVGYSMEFHSRKQCEKWINLMQNYLPHSQIIELNN